MRLRVVAVSGLATFAMALLGVASAWAKEPVFVTGAPDERADQELLAKTKRKPAPAKRPAKKPRQQAEEEEEDEDEEEEEEEAEDEEDAAPEKGAAAPAEPPPASAAKPTTAATVQPTVAAKPSAAPEDATDAKGAAPGESWPLLIGAGVHYYIDSGTVTGRVRRSILEEKENFDFENDNAIAVSLEVIKPFSRRFRVGATLRYFFDYELTLADDEDEEPEVFLWGQLFELTARGDFMVPFGDNWDAFLSLQAGPALLVPGGALQEEIDALREQDVGVWNVPRLGIVGGASLGARYRLVDGLFVRPEVALFWERLFLFNTEETVNSVPFSKEREADIRRLMFSVSLELGL
jgi:hypothetical protein